MTSATRLVVNGGQPPHRVQPCSLGISLRSAVLSADAFDPPTRPEVVVGRYVLVLGDPAGTAIVPAASPSQDKARPLAHAIAQARREHEPPPTSAASLESAVDDVSRATSKAERAVSLFTEIAQRRIDPAAISDEVDALLGLLRRLDHDERWEEVLRVARSLAMLLALLGRWVDLLQSLRVALSAAEQLGDGSGKAWGLHELGTLHLAADKHVEADRLLSQARDLRERIGDRHGLVVTDRNLQILCRALRALLHEPRRGGALGQILRRPVSALVFGILLLLVVGGAAGAVIRGSGNAGDSTTNRPLVVGVELTPTSPRVGEPVVFRATVEGGAHPAHYAWRFSHGDRATAANPTYVYRRLGTYTVTVRVSGVRGAATGEGTRTVIVHRESPSQSPPPNARFWFQPNSPVVGQPVSFNATSSSDPDPRASITSYIWKFGDHYSETGPTPTHRYAGPGTYRTELIVADARGASDSTVRMIAVSKGVTTTTASRKLDSAPVITSADSTTFVEGTEGSFTVTATGIPSPMMRKTGTLPNGVTLKNGVLSGTATTTGSFPISFTATNSVRSFLQNFTLTVNPKPASTSENETTFTDETAGASR
jgi:PKD repeat protein